MGSVEAAESELAEGLRSLGAHTRYAEVMAESQGGESLRLDKNATTLAFRPRLSGAVFRAWDGGGWAEAATSRLDRSGISEAVGALRHRLATPRGARDPPGAPATGRASVASPAKRPLANFSHDERRALARAAFGWATAVPGVENAMVNFQNFRTERLFLSTAGAHQLQRIDRVGWSVAPLAIEGGRVEFDYVSRGGSGGAELFESASEEEVAETAREARALLGAHSPPTGRMPVLLDSTTSGTFAHESFGHGTEADQLLRDRSYLKPLLGSAVAPEMLTIVDDGSRPGDWGSIFYDDEGFPAHRTVLVDRGRFVEVLHDRESAAEMHRSPTGNCRRADFLSRPFVRMTNTLVEPGDWSEEELLKEAKEGVVMEHCTTGIEDPLGGQMQIKVRKGHRIVRGERGEIVSSMALSGRVLDFLRSVRGVGRASPLEITPGLCGKGHTDILPAGTGGPSLLAEAIVGPA